MILAYVVVLFLNILQITYFMLFSRHESCKNIEFPFGLLRPNTRVQSAKSWNLQIRSHFNDSTVTDRRCAKSAEQKGEDKSVNGAAREGGLRDGRGRHRGSQCKQTFRPKSPMLSKYTKLDITKLPDGTRFKTTDNKTFNMEYYVEDGVFVGSGTETVNKA
ncbi:hypothetical protein OESDEN_04994 [Oesophagostomum dentatum]|uniref:Uncharacterized protein n=1 Tax=Oesophagostomum dentatum TaxID=61180 RepID=A0A0B1TBZ8_OESDE|nr:hypothetical protein OESDEN_04994 [Oesophagostomum dentatum]